MTGRASAPAIPLTPSLLLSDLEQVRLLADPLRLRIVEALNERPATAKQVALTLGEKPSRIYHHVALLERAGLLRLVESRRKRGTTERYLAASAPLALRLTASDVPEVVRKLRALLEQALPARGTDDGTAYHLLLGLYPADRRGTP